MRAAPIFASLLLASAGTTAQTPASSPMVKHACTASAALPPTFATFAHPAPAVQGGVVPIGQAVTLALMPATPFALPPGHAPAAGTFGGMMGFDVTEPGTYRVALNAGLWIDVIQASASVRSTAHAPGPACTGVRKTVDFVLTSGHYVLQLSGSEKPSVTFQVAKLS